MFTNLIESSSHAGEFKRRGSFFLFTTVTYFLLFAIAGLASIYAYDARLEDQNTEELVLLSPVEIAAPERPPTAHNPSSSRTNNNNRSAVAVRETPMLGTNRPDVVPVNTSAKPNTNPPIPEGTPYVVGRGNSDPVADGPGTVGSSRGSGNGEAISHVEISTPPPPVVEKPKPQIVRKSNVLNGEALSLPKPPYPLIAKQLKIQGTVSVQVLISESGKVLSAKAVSGNPALVTAAQQAALQARFSPTILGDQPVKVSGVITYNFVLSQ